MVEMDTTGERTPHGVGEIIRRFGAAYTCSRPVSAWHRRVLRALAACRTAALGGHLERCEACSFERPVYNSCGNRNCPTCQGKLSRKWLSGRMADLLNTPYFHCVFTLPDAFNVLAGYNASVLYGLLFKAASETLKAMARKHLDGGQLGMIGVLHTWGQTLWLHPHVHFVVTGGALSADRSSWFSTGPDFLFDVYEMSGAFRKRFCALLRKATLDFSGEASHLADPGRFEAFVAEQEARGWVVYCKKPFAGPRQVLAYIARYTHRVAISNRRIVDVAEDGTVTFDYKDYSADSGRAPTRRMRLSAVEFIGRFLRHILPRGFRKIRAYGLLAGANKAEKLAAARALLGPTPDLEQDCTEEREDDPPSQALCPQCGRGIMRRHRELLPGRAPPVIRPWKQPSTRQAA